MVTDGNYIYCVDQINLKSLYCTPKTNIILHVNYTSNLKWMNK